MSLSPTSVTDRFPELASVSSTLVEACFDEAVLEINRTAWGVRADMGTLYLAAHKVLVGSKGKSASVGPVQNKRVGNVSIGYGAQFGAIDNADAMLKSTPYGAEYLRLRSLVFAQRMAC